jgi:hypothetical protein
VYEWLPRRRVAAASTLIGRPFAVRLYPDNAMLSPSLRRCSCVLEQVRLPLFVAFLRSRTRADQRPARRRCWSSSVGAFPPSPHYAALIGRPFAVRLYPDNAMLSPSLRRCSCVLEPPVPHTCRPAPRPPTVLVIVGRGFPSIPILVGFLLRADALARRQCPLRRSHWPPVCRSLIPRQRHALWSSSVGAFPPSPFWSVSCRSSSSSCW